jgi:hypothetical protein
MTPPPPTVFWEARDLLAAKLLERLDLTWVSAQHLPSVRQELRPVVHRLCAMAYPDLDPVTRDVLACHVLTAVGEALQRGAAG